MPRQKSPGPGQGKLAPLSMRTTRAVRDQIERAAAASGRSLTDEVESRLERTFVEDRERGEGQEVDKKLHHLRAGVEMCMRHIEGLEAELAKLREMVAKALEQG